MTRWVSWCSEQALWSKPKASSWALWYEAANQEPWRRKIKASGRKFQALGTVAYYSSLWVFDLLSWYSFINSNYWNILPSGSPDDHARLVTAAQVLVETIDSEEGSSNSKSLVERLEEAPKKIFDVMTATSKNYLTHMIGVVKSYLPHFNLAPIAKGIAPTCSDEKFRDYCKESKVIAEEILKNMAE